MPADSLINNIVPSECNKYVIVFHNSYWYNGKMGSITDAQGDCVFRFYEAREGKLGAEIISEKPEDNPLVATGIVAYCIHNRLNENKTFEKLHLSKFVVKSVINQFIGYTAQLFDKYKVKREQEPDSWRCNIEAEFYDKIIIPLVQQQNKESEALFEYVTPDDCIYLRGIMQEYILYLEEQRKKYKSRDLSSEDSLDHALDRRVKLAFDKYKGENVAADSDIDEIFSEQNEQTADSEIARLRAKVVEMEKCITWDYDEEESTQHDNEPDKERQIVKEPLVTRQIVDNDAEIVMRLTPLFYNSKQDAQAFLKKVKGLDNPAITGVVCDYLIDRKLAPSTKGRKLWAILSNAGIYHAGGTNWDTAIRKNPKYKMYLRQQH
ncbi:MAG: hypothetical protein IK144_01130 [Bacteroidaceae bacterium]|nr:hypothetical protein [Bacteroidaceae bacterium]